MLGRSNRNPFHCTSIQKIISKKFNPKKFTTLKISKVVKNIQTARSYCVCAGWKAMGIAAVDSYYSNLSFSSPFVVHRVEWRWFFSPRCSFFFHTDISSSYSRASLFVYSAPSLSLTIQRMRFLRTKNPPADCSDVSILLRFKNMYRHTLT
jgi:hypothetical protein